MKNTQQINNIHFEKTVYPFCPMGNDNYKGEIKVDFEPDQELFDFCEVDSKITELGQEELIIEELVDAVFQIMLAYHPKRLFVAVYGNSNKHFPVIVTKQN